jgi:hypothetical protein
MKTNRNEYLLHSIDATTRTAKRDPLLMREVEPTNLGGWLTVLILVVIVVAVFGEPVYRGITS